MESITSSGENPWNLRLEESAFAFINEVKQAPFHDQDGKSKFDDFFNVMESHNVGRINLEDCVALVEVIFEGHEKIISGFKKFLSNFQETKTEEVSLVTCENKNQNHVKNKEESCIKYLEKVEDRFKKNPYVFDKFLTSLGEYRKGDDDVVTVYKKIVKLFISHFDLIDEFDCFLTDLDEETREKLEEIKTRSKLSKLGKLSRNGKYCAKLARRVIRCSRRILKGKFTEKTRDYFSDDDIEYLRELHGGTTEELEKEMKRDPTELFGDIIIPRLKMKVEVNTEVCKKMKIRCNNTS